MVCWSDKSWYSDGGTGDNAVSAEEIRSKERLQHQMMLRECRRVSAETGYLQDCGGVDFHRLRSGSKRFGIPNLMRQITRLYQNVERRHLQSILRLRQAFYIAV